MDPDTGKTRAIRTAGAAVDISGTLFTHVLSEAVDMFSKGQVRIHSKRNRA